MSAHMVPIGEVVDFIGGGTPSRDVDEYWNGSIPWASVKDFKGPSIDSTLESITHDGLSASSSALIPAGHVIMPTRMALGKAAINSIDVAINQDLKALKPKARIETRYLLHAILSRATEIQSHGKGATVKGITIERLRAIQIPLPPLEEQRRIAAILDKGESIKALFAKREKAFLSAEESLFSALHEGDNRGLTGRTYSLSDVFWFQEGPGVRNWQFTSSGVKLLNVGNITKDGKVDLLRSERYISEDEAFGRYHHFLVDEGDLLMPSSGIPIEEDGLLRTRSAFARNSDLPLCMNTSTIRFKPKMERASLLFLQGWLQSREFRVQITKLVTGSAQKNFGPSHLKQLSVTLPHSDLQDDFEKRLLRIRKLRHSLNPSESNLAALLFSLGNLAFNGGSLV